MDVKTFCDMVMADYERQWSEARGHQERHPIGAKMHTLSELVEQAADAQDFRKLLTDGCGGDDPIRSLLCEELTGRWDAASTTGSPASGKKIGPSGKTDHPTR